MSEPASSRRRAVLLGVFLCTAARLSVAAQPPSLAEVVEAGFKRYPEAELVQAIRRQGAAIRRQASSLLAGDPAVVLRYENAALGGGNGYRQWEGGLAAPLWLPGQRQRRGRVAEATEAQSAATLRLQRWKVAGEIRDLLWSLAIAAAELELAARGLEGTRELEQDVSRRVRAGELARADLVLAQRETIAKRIEVAEAQSRERVLRSQYQLVTGLSELPADFSETVSEGERIAHHHPALVARRVAAERSRAERDQVLGERRASPVLLLGGKAERPESGLAYDDALIVELNLPLGSRAQAAPRTAAAEHALTQATTALARARLEVEKDLLEALAARRQAAETLELARAQQELAAEALRLSRRAFELGENSLFRVLEARRQALAAARTLRLSELELGRAAARLNQALGVIPE